MQRSWLVPFLLLVRLITIAAWTGVLYLEGCFFIKEERILLLFPWLARHVSVSELARNGKAYEHRWIRTEGLIASIKEPTAILHAQGAAAGDASVLLHNLPALGVYTSSLASLPNEQTVEVVGEWETGRGTFALLHLDIVGVIKPLQMKYLLSVFGILALVPALAALTWIVFLHRKKPKISLLRAKKPLLK